MATAVFLTHGLPNRSRGVSGRHLVLLRTLAQAGLGVHLITELAAGERQSDAAPLLDMCRHVDIFSREPGRTMQAVLASIRCRSFLHTRRTHSGIIHLLVKVLASTRIVVATEPAHVDMIDEALGIMHKLDMAPATKPYILLDLGAPLSRRLMMRSAEARWPATWAMSSEAAAIRQLEASAASRSNLVTVISDLDMQQVQHKSPATAIWVVGNTLEVDVRPAREAYVAMAPVIAFCGDVNLSEHRRAAVWLAREIMPMVRAIVPGTSLRIVGDRTSRRLSTIARQPGVELRDSTDPQAFAHMVRSCPVAVAPQRRARATTEPVLAALAAGRAVVSTRAVASMLLKEATAAPVRAETGPEFADQLSLLLRDRAGAYDAATRGQQIVKVAYSHEQHWGRISTLAESLTGPSPLEIVQSDAPTQPRVLTARDLLRTASPSSQAG